MKGVGRGTWVFLLAVAVSCAHPAPVAQPVATPTAQAQPAAPPDNRPQAAHPDTTPAPKPKQRVVPPAAAFQLGLMPLSSTGVSGFRLLHPTWDGRGVLIAILDSGVDPGIEGLQTTTTGDPKILDVRDVSGEGDVGLHQNGDGTWSGVLREIRFGDAPAADFNGNGTNTDTFHIDVAKDSAGGWKARIADRPWMHDFLVHRETFTLGTGPITGAFNISDEDGRPKLAVFLETSGHGSHVAGIAAGHNIYGVSGFNGVAPGAQIIGVRIADNSRGGISTTGSMLRGMEYAVRFARERHLPLVMNMSFGVGNGIEGHAVMDSIIDAFLTAHPDVFFSIAAGNDGPGTSTLGEPGSAELAMSVGATYPASYDILQYQNGNEALAWFSSRGGEIAKPDVVAPGVAYSTVPGWNMGDEVKGGTSMATPHVTGLAAVLVSAMIQSGKPYDAALIRSALRASGRILPGHSYIDEGTGLAQIDAAWQWLSAAHPANHYHVEALANGPAMQPGIMPSDGRGVAPVEQGSNPPGAYHRGLGAADSVQRFRVTLDGQAGGPAGSQNYRLVSDASWLRTSSTSVTIDPRTRSAVVEARYDRSALTLPGRYVGTIRALGADSTAGPAFVLSNTVIVSSRKAIQARHQTATAGTAARYYVDVPANAGSLTATLSIADTTEQGTLYFFEPSGRPARGIKSEDIGHSAGRTATCTVAAEDVVPGIWEIVVQAMPGKDLVYDLEARVSPIQQVHAAGAEGSGTGTALSVRSTSDTTVLVGVVAIGAARSEDVTIENGAPIRRTIVVPDWAKEIVVEAEMTAEQWDLFTDFALTVYDTAGAQLGNGDMNYPFHRMDADLPEHRAAGYRVVVELFPSFANAASIPRVPMHLRIRLEGDSTVIVPATPQHLGPTGVTIPVPAQQAPPGWQRLVRLRAGADADEGAMTQVITLPGR